jgi:2-keto-4-pentenoate hydratase/2-oxohepta-3-ene-1,7-dioic acid hydratase in catechol pathway
MHHEVELGVVIGKNGRDIPESEAESYIAGYSTYDPLDWADGSAGYGYDG